MQTGAFLYTVCYNEQVMYSFIHFFVSVFGNDPEGALFFFSQTISQDRHKTRSE